MTSYTGWFTNASPADKKRALSQMRKFALEKIDETDFLNRNDFSRTPLPFPDRLNSQRYRAKAFVLFLTSLQPRDFYSGKILDVMALLSKHGFKILHPVDPTHPNEPANQLLLGRGPFSAHEELQHPNVNREILDSHAISEEAFEAFKNRDYTMFLQLRKEALMKLEQEFMQQRGVLPNEHLLPEEPLIDTD